MPGWLLGVIAALWEAVKPYIPPAVYALVGVKLQEGEKAKEDLRRIEKAAAAGADMRSKPFADKLQFLDRRGRVRGVPK